MNIYLAIRTVIKGRYDNTFYSSMGEWCERVLTWRSVYTQVYGYLTWTSVYKHVYWYLTLLLHVDVYIVMYKCSKLMRQITCLYFTSIWMIFKKMNEIHGTIQSIILKRCRITAVLLLYTHWRGDKCWCKKIYSWVKRLYGGKTIYVIEKCVCPIVIPGTCRIIKVSKKELFAFFHTTTLPVVIYFLINMYTISLNCI